MTQAQATYTIDTDDIPIDSVDTEREWTRAEVMERCKYFEIMVWCVGDYLWSGVLSSGDRPV